MLELSLHEITFHYLQLQLKDLTNNKEDMNLVKIYIINSNHNFVGIFNSCSSFKLIYSLFVNKKTQYKYFNTNTILY